MIASSDALAAVAETTRREWAALGVTGHLLARNLDTGEQLGFDVDRPIALASVAKVPIALAALELIATGELDPAQRIRIDPDDSAPGSTGTASFRHPAEIALKDLITLMLTVSDNAASDHVLARVGLTRVNAALHRWGADQIQIRHPMRTMFESASGASEGRFETALELAVRPGADGTSAISALAVDQANVGTARALAQLLQDAWQDRIADTDATAELRRLMAMQVFTHRLGSDLRADTLRLSSKTGSFLNLRHEIGVVEAASGERVVIAALTRSDRIATLAQDVDLAIGAAARATFEALRT